MTAPERHARCDACQALCCRLTVVLQAGVDDVPAHLTTHLESGLPVMARDEDGWCSAMDRTHMNCGIYEQRPATCRRFVMDGPYCRTIQQPELPPLDAVETD